MGRARVHQEIRVMRFEDLLDRHERGDPSRLEAAELLGISERMFRRWRLFPAGTGPVALPNAGALARWRQLQ